MLNFKTKLSLFSEEKEEDLSKIGIYCIYFTNKPEKYYVGSAGIKGSHIPSSKGFWSRWRLHLSELRKNKHHSRHLQHAYNKYGENNMKFKILELCEDITVLQEREQYWIDNLNSYENGYNILPFARSSAGKIVPLNKNGKPVCQYSIDGRLVATYPSAREATRQLGTSYKAIYKCCNGQAIIVNGFIWRYLGEDFCKFKTVPEIDVTKKRVKQYDKNMNFIKEYPTITEASKETGVTLSNISMCLHNQRNSAGGYLWKV